MRRLDPLLLPIALGAVCLVSAASASETTPKLSAAEKAAAARVTAAEISAHTRFLSDDLLEGRFPGSRGDALAMAYLAAQLEAFGYQPGATDADGKPLVVPARAAAEAHLYRAAVR